MAVSGRRRRVTRCASWIERNNVIMSVGLFLKAIRPAGLLCPSQTGDDGDEIRFFVVAYVHFVQRFPHIFQN